MSEADEMPKTIKDYIRLNSTIEKDAVVEGETSRIGSGGPERGSVGETVSRLINRLSLKSRREEHRGRGQKSKGERLMINIHSCVALEWMKPQSRWWSCWYPVGYTVP